MRVLTRVVVLLVTGSMIGGGLVLLAGIGCTIPIRRPKPTPPKKESAGIERLKAVLANEQRQSDKPGVFV